MTESPVSRFRNSVPLAKKVTTRLTRLTRSQKNVVAIFGSVAVRRVAAPKKAPATSPPLSKLPSSSTLKKSFVSPKKETKDKNTTAKLSGSATVRAAVSTTARTELPRQRSSAVFNFNRAANKHLTVTRNTEKHRLKSSNTSSSDSWRNWPDLKRKPTVLPQCRRSGSCNSSDSSDISLDVSDREESNTDARSRENFLNWLHIKTLTIVLDPDVSNRTWKVNKLAMKKLSPEKCSVRDLRLGLEYVTGIPFDITYFRVAQEEMKDSGSLEKVALNGGVVTLCIYSIWQDFVRILLTGNIKNITEAIVLMDPNTAPVNADVFSVMVAHDESTRKEVSVTDILRQAPSDLDHFSRAELEKVAAHNQMKLKMPIYTLVEEKNLVTTEMREEIISKRLHAALLFALVNKHKLLVEWIFAQPNIDFHYRYASGRNLIFFMVFFCNVSRLTEFVAAKIDWEAGDLTDTTPTKLAKRTRNEKIISIFEELEDALEDDGKDGKKKKKRRGKSMKGVKGTARN